MKNGRKRMRSVGPRKRTKNKCQSKKVVSETESSPSSSSWIFRTSFQKTIECFVLSSSLILILSKLDIYISLAISSIVTFVSWLLSDPDRSLRGDFYDEPRRFLLTGSASGMSLQIAKRLIRDGHYVAVSDARIDVLRGIFRHISTSKCLILHLDVTDPQAWDNAMKEIENKWGGLDVCFNIAGVLCPNRIQHSTPREIQLQIDVNVKGVSLGTRAASRFMMKHQITGQVQNKQNFFLLILNFLTTIFLFSCRHIVNFSSMGGVATVAGVTLYAASKYAVRGLSLASSKDLAGTGIDVTCFMPDAVQTPMVDLQLLHDDASMAFSGKVLSLEEVESCIFNDILPNRPVETWLSSRARVARFGTSTFIFCFHLLFVYHSFSHSSFSIMPCSGDIFGNSRIVALVERAMKISGRKRQEQIKHDMASSLQKTEAKNQHEEGLSKLPDQTSSKSFKVSSSSILWALVRVLATSYFFLRLVAAAFLLIQGTKATRRLSMKLETAEEIARLQSSVIQGRTYIVTGASSGIGEETARALAVGGGKVIVATRSETRGLAAVSRINSDFKVQESGGSARFEYLDLASFENVDSFIKHLDECELAAIVLNAGVITPTFSTTRDGVESNLQINHLAQQYLVTSLLDHCSSSNFTSKIRVVVVSSWEPSRRVKLGSRETGGLEHYRSPQDYKMFGAYGMSKQCGVRFARELAKRFSDRVSSYALHPGLIPTSLGTARSSSSLRVQFERFGSRMFWWVTSHFLRVKTIEEGAATTVHAITRAADESAGMYYDDSKLSLWPREEDNDPKRLALRDEMDKACWETSERIISEARRGKFLDDSSSISTNTEEHLNMVYDYVTIIFFHVLAYYLLFSVAEAAIVSPGGLFSSTRKINPRSSSASIVKREKRRTISSAVVDALYHVLISHGVSMMPIAEASWTRVAFLVVLIVFWTDFHFYFTHRMLHTITFLYENVHVSHHESHNPNPWSSCSFHPVEAVIFFSAYLIVFFVDFPLELWWMFKIGMVLGPLHAHVGYNLDSFGILGPHHHYLHHRFKRGNFGGTFSFSYSLHFFVMLLFHIDTHDTNSLYSLRNVKTHKMQSLDSFRFSHRNMG